MNIKEKAKAYDAAIERAKYYQKENGSAVITAIFPELSYDEKMRKMAIKAVYAPEAQECIKSWKVNPDDVIAWIKKQSKKSSWSEKDEINCQLIQTIVCYSNITADLANKLSNWLKSLKERIGG